MNTEPTYHIGQTGRAWGSVERKQWFDEQRIQRSYQNDVVDKLRALNSVFKIEQYSALSFDPKRYPLFVVKNKINSAKATALITGGVHGYETSGVQGAIRFLETRAQHYQERYNLLVAPCVSPWAYETINRWNPDAIDPNRSFMNNSPSQESAALMDMVQGLKIKLDVHIDLHETTDSDNDEFRPALAARDNVVHEFWTIPDGFYLVGDTENPCHEFQKHIINAVKAVTHISPSDDQGRIIGESISQQGVINYATKALSLCTGFSDARFNTTTEVYPDSPLVDDENCIQAQVAAICSGLDFVQQEFKP